MKPTWPVGRIARWYSRAWCAVDGHQWMPNGRGSQICIRTGCRERERHL